MLIFDHSRPGRTATSQLPAAGGRLDDLPVALRRKAAPALPEVSELDVVRHYTRLSQKNFSIDTQFYPLGSCTMKYNPRACNSLAMLPQFLARHPASPDETGQGFLASMFELQEMLKDVTGMAGVSMAPMAGAHGEFAGVAMIRAYHDARGDTARREIIVPDAAHGTNPATATMCGYTVKEIPTDATGSVDLAALKAAVGPQTAGLMLTNPSTLGVFEKTIVDIQKIVHDAGGLLYYDGANLNAILGKVRPGDMGFDVIHMNLHKTFSTPHGGGGPGAGPVGVAERLLPFMPIPLVLNDNGLFRLATEMDLPQSIGRLSANMGNAGVLMRAYIYARLLGREGMHRVAEYATLNANYLMAELRKAGFDLAFPERRASHEFIVTLKKLKDATGVSAMDFAKRLLDYGYHAPTTYFPLLVPECLLIEPTETESRETLDGFIAAMKTIKHEAETSPELVKGAPYSLPVRRLDDVKAARELDLAYQPAEFILPVGGTSALQGMSDPVSPYKGKTGLQRLFNAVGYTWDGLRAAFKHEDAFRQEVFLAMLLIPLALYLGKTGVERALMIAAVLGVLMVELLNSAVEAAVDRISLEHHLLIKRAKDMGSAAVMIALVNAVVVWALVLLG